MVMYPNGWILYNALFPNFGQKHTPIIGKGWNFTWQQTWNLKPTRYRCNIPASLLTPIMEIWRCSWAWGAHAVCKLDDSTRLAYQKGAYSEPNSTMTSLNMVLCPTDYRKLPNDLVRRNTSKYTSQYINRLMSMILETEQTGEGQGFASFIVTRRGGQSILGWGWAHRAKKFAPHYQVNRNYHSNFQK